MASSTDRRMWTPLLGALAAVAGTGGLSFIGTGLTPLPWATWLAPLPIMLLAPRASAKLAAGAAGLAWLIGELNLASYLVTDIGMPVGLVIGLFVGLALVFAAVVVLARALILRRQYLAAAVAVPAAWVAAEYGFATASPDGAFWSLAYTQADVIPVLQVASVTGYYGITFLLMLVPTAMAVLGAPGVSTVVRWRVGVATAAVVLVSVGYGLIRPPARSVDGPTERIALVAVRQDGGRLDLATPEGAAMLEAYVEQVRGVAAGGAGTVVLPEAVLKVDVGSLSTVDGPMQRLADETGARIVFGLAVIDPAAGTIDGRPGGYNTARVYAPNAPAQTYHKQHLIVTERYRPGSSLLLGSLNQQFTWAVAICKDLDFPELARANRSAGMDVMLVPAWDFDRDAWLHSRMAIMRGVETGATIARAARSGALTISDPWGRVLVEERTVEAVFVTATADVPLRSTPTPWTRLGPWFAWLCVALLVGAVGLLLRRQSRDVPSAMAPAEPPLVPVTATSSM